MIAGIDPGAHGAIAILSPDGEIVDIADMPGVEIRTGGKIRSRVSAQGLAMFLRAHALTHAYVERVGSMPNQGVGSSFAFGYAAGVVEGVLASLAVPVSFVSPVTWKRALSLPADKGNARQLAMQLWPAHAARFARVKDDGRAEAVLLAHWGLQTQRTIARAAA